MLIDRESFFGRYMFNTVENRNWELKVPLFPVRKVKEGLMWKELPRKIWVYSKEDSYINRLCFESIRAAGIFSEYKVYELRDTHLMGHLGSVMIKKIEEAIRTIP